MLPTWRMTFSRCARPRTVRRYIFVMQFHLWLVACAVASAGSNASDCLHINDGAPCDAVTLCCAERPTSIHHWQLRDLVSPGATDDDIYIVHEQTAWAYDGGRCSHTAVANLGFQPNSLAARHGFLAAGGQHGEVGTQIHIPHTGHPSFTDTGHPSFTDTGHPSFTDTGQPSFNHLVMLLSLLPPSPHLPHPNHHSPPVPH